MSPIVHLVGRFPPPYDGQTLATQRLGRMLAPALDVRTFDTAIKDQGMEPSGLAKRWKTFSHYMRGRKSLRESLSVAPNAPVLWGSISPLPLGHARDRIATLPCFLPSQKVIAVTHNQMIDVFSRAAFRRSVRRMVQRVDRLVFLSDYLAQQVAPWVPESKQAIIPYTVEPCATPEQLKRKWQDRESHRPLKLLYLSNMIASKGYLDVLEAAGEVKARGLDVEVSFAGRWDRGEDEAHFFSRVDELGIRNIVTHHGQIRDRDTINKLHRKADVFLLPTYYPVEAQPISIIESLSAATPVIVTQHAGIRDMVRQGKEGRFVPPRSPSAIAKAIGELAHFTTWLKASMAARNRYNSMFAEDAVRQKWLELLSSYVSL